jgi:4'-phosphopantetheinyl transferase
MSSEEVQRSGNNSGELGPICAGEAHVWLAHLDLPPVEIRSLAALLSADEHDRAQRLRFAVDRQRFIAGRAILRLLLGSLLQAVPSDLRFHYSPSGKPLLDPRRNPEDVRFNTTHANGLALYGVTKGQEIGIDLERQTGDAKRLDIADQFFSAPERQVLRTLPSAEQLHTFYAYWTRKEAYLKGIGTGLQDPLDRFCVPLGTAKPVRIRRSEAIGEAGRCQMSDVDESWVPGSWLIYEIMTPLGYSAALALDGELTSVHQWEVACREGALVPVQCPLP